MPLCSPAREFRELFLLHALRRWLSVSTVAGRAVQWCSTAAGIGDFRGKSGKWTEEEQKRDDDDQQAGGVEYEVGS